MNRLALLALALGLTATGCGDKVPDRDAVVTARNKGVDWALQQQLSSPERCAELKDSNARSGCEAFLANAQSADQRKTNTPQSASTSAPASALEMPKHLSCASAPISRWEDGTMIYELETQNAMVAFPQKNYIFSGTFTQESKTRGSLSLHNMLNVSTGQLSGGVNRTEHLEVLSVNAEGLYTLKNSAGVQYCLAG